jgi:hypothetical protein
VPAPCHDSGNARILVNKSAVVSMASFLSDFL